MKKETSKLLQEALLDAKAVRDTALANAELVLKEAFTPRLQAMLSTKLQQEAEDEINEFESVEADGTGVNGFMGRDGDVMNEEDKAHTVDPQGPSKELSAGVKDTDTDSTVALSGDSPKATGKLSSDKTDDTDCGPGDNIKFSDKETSVTPNLSEDEDAELNSIIAELEGEIAGDLDTDLDDELEDIVGGEDEMGVAPEVAPEVPVADEQPISAPVGVDPSIEVDGEESAAVAVDGVADDSEEEEIDLEEILREMELGSDEVNESEDDKSDEKYEELMEQIASLKEENHEYKKAFGYLRGKLNEVNLLNAKLLFTNKVFKSFGLNNDQKMRVVESFDRSRNVREVKLTYANLCESFNMLQGGKKKSAITEGIASKVSGSTKPKKEVITEKKATESKGILSEGNEMTARLQKLAGIKLS